MSVLPILIVLTFGTGVVLAHLLHINLAGVRFADSAVETVYFALVDSLRGPDSTGVYP
ncbi:hypothetical protein [Mastigocoleus sp. MO_188.B34]|uniref:hypothetical protein n=1 Tax=Mastigocoleus sp. MO_188.B34 TaxID=3036635 RepID=UPI0026312DCE|nr:hypothetical protein [Mastigocoleus sp. MO_188.B34]